MVHAGHATHSFVLNLQVLEEARERAQREPVRLSKNWGMAVVIFVIWIASLEAGLYCGILNWGESQTLTKDAEIVIHALLLQHEFLMH